MNDQSFDAAPFGWVARLRLTRPYWNDLVVPANAINPAGPVAPPLIDATDGTLLFRNGAVNTVTFQVQLPHTWAEGTEIGFHIHWCKTVAAAGTVLWEYQYDWANIGTVFGGFSLLTAGAEFVPNSDVANKHSIYAFPNLVGTGMGISSIVKIWLQRTGTGDTYASNAKLISADFHIQENTLGSDLSEWDKAP